MMAITDARYNGSNDVTLLACSSCVGSFISYPMCHISPPYLLPVSSGRQQIVDLIALTGYLRHVFFTVYLASPILEHCKSQMVSLKNVLFITGLGCS
jgi:hypothetical protein